jgi:hypothetical protein
MPLTRRNAFKMTGLKLKLGPRARIATWGSAAVPKLWPR